MKEPQKHTQNRKTLHLSDDVKWNSVNIYGKSSISILFYFIFEQSVETSLFPDDIDKISQKAIPSISINN